MKITTEHIGRLLEARLERIQRAARPDDQEPPSRPGADRVTFSSFSDDVRAALAAARTAEEDADPRLESLEKALAAGQYRVPAEDVADALLRDLRGR